MASFYRISTVTVTQVNYSGLKIIIIIMVLFYLSIRYYAVLKEISIR